VPSIALALDHGRKLMLGSAPALTEPRSKIAEFRQAGIGRRDRGEAADFLTLSHYRTIHAVLIFERSSDI